MKYYYFYPTPLDEVDDDNDNIDVCLKVEDGREYTLVVTTPNGIKSIMERTGLSYIEPGAPFLLVERLSDANIRNLIESLVNENERWLRVYGTDFA